jgi:hypothetical protein
MLQNHTKSVTGTNAPNVALTQQCSLITDCHKLNSHISTCFDCKKHIIELLKDDLNVKENFTMERSILSEWIENNLDTIMLSSIVFISVILLLKR